MDLFWVVVLIISLSYSPLSHGAADTISGSKYITKGTSIVSLGGRFELGFFTPDKSSNYYIGIWYQNISPQTVVWVANRSKPIPSVEINSAKLLILEGNLVLTTGGAQGGVVWSTNISSDVALPSPPQPVMARLNDDGNLVLRYKHTETPRWQSFENPTDTVLPFSKFGFNKHTGKGQVYTSWKSSEDPSPGLYSFARDAIASFQRWNGTEEYWNSGPFVNTTHQFQNLPRDLGTTLLNSTFVNNDNETYFIYNIKIPSFISRHVVDKDGQVKHFAWMNTTKDWQLFYTQPVQQCDIYAYCGPFGICNQNASTFCTCLQGFKPRSERDWGQNYFNGGCVRITNLEEEEDKFKEYPNMLLPRHPQNVTVGSGAGCKSACLNNCSCTAYAYHDDTYSCSFWVGELFNLKQQDAGGNTIYIRLASYKFSNVKDKNSKGLSGKVKVIVPSAVVAATVVCSLAFVYYFKTKRAKLQNAESGMGDGTGAIDDLMIGEDDDEGIDVQLFSFESILAATDHFSESNKLGKGGFGPVYKGKFPGGQEIAVKRMGSHSNQGMKEFKNELLLIAKLQHRNLVKLLGYCMQAKEKILIYEYMPNKSLDTFLFDQTRRMLLNWNKRLDIILGIIRALVYLHHDSRLRIIHRDLKTNNILLDEDLMPKISDFGLARIVEGKTIEANTKKIVGTYGYMPPEYALDGLFSIKSDVFNFGVVMLEIITGKNNSAFYEHEEVSNLLGYVWNLWNKGKAMDLVDESVVQSCNEDEVLKCINVGLLCVEEDPNKRPNMSNVLLMLSNENTALPKPNQPAFVARTHTSLNSNTVEFDKSCSNELTISDQEGR
ncbi:PREDICTED: G-type lectin S-receptor-like serine/threonine-protein kinase RKS1 [Ipomoea nil]|uniref:G-type lectin S-receptor-like serine/threonine-protein kinase RKS1 n=1 Tax=Ipomoea nil TaxID=35883 RepID=UPI0009017355|nr:PREDICTED: G-type lectin S-receptor-like serine/threonine-protein kinase RKS1 [Ipomoea nil]